MKDIHVVGSKMTRNDGKMAKLIGSAFHFETEFTVNLSNKRAGWNKRVWWPELFLLHEKSIFLCGA